MNTTIQFLIDRDCLINDYLFIETINSLYKKQSDTEKNLKLFYKSKKVKK
jgi:hypothetical protein